MNTKLYKKRLIALYSCWRKYNKDLWGQSEILVIFNPSPSSSYKPNPISSQFFTWLLGHKLDDAIVVFTLNTIYIICDKKKVTFLQSVTSPSYEAVHANVEFKPKCKGDDGFALLDMVITKAMVAARKDNDNRVFVVGAVADETPRSQILDRCNLALKQPKYQKVRINDGVKSLSLLKFVDLDESSKNGDDVEMHKMIQMERLPEPLQAKTVADDKEKAGVPEAYDPDWVLIE